MSKTLQAQQMLEVPTHASRAHHARAEFRRRGPAARWWTAPGPPLLPGGRCLPPLRRRCPARACPAVVARRRAWCGEVGGRVQHSRDSGIRTSRSRQFTPTRTSHRGQCVLAAEAKAPISGTTHPPLVGKEAASSALRGRQAAHLVRRYVHGSRGHLGRNVALDDLAGSVRCVCWRCSVRRRPPLMQGRQKNTARFRNTGGHWPPATKCGGDQLQSSWHLRTRVSSPSPC